MTNLYLFGSFGFFEGLARALDLGANTGGICGI
jgi:hypothetical protein